MPFVGQTSCPEEEEELCFDNVRILIPVDVVNSGMGTIECLYQNDNKQINN
jgi:hypothetical protein